jgi:hypothetical protein
MAERQHTGIPDCLTPLLQPNPTGAAMLISAWNGLSVETQIQLLEHLEQAKFPSYLADKIRAKALDTPNAYVRYLTASGFYFRDDDPEERKQLKQRIDADPDPLVRYCLLENGYIGDPQAFFSLPHQARLACVCRLKGFGENIAKLIEYAVDHQLRDGTVSEIELFEILSDYVNRDEFKDWYKFDRTRARYDGFGQYLEGKDIEALWRLILKLPEQVSSVLVENLPPSAGLSAGIPEEVLSGMSKRQLEILFYRADVGLQDLRKKMFLSEGEGHEDLRGAAVCHNFDLTYAEFGAILEKPEEQKVKILENLAFWGNDLSLCILDAIHDALYASDALFASEKAIFARDALERTLSSLTGWQRQKQVRELRLYRLARLAVPWERSREGIQPQDDLAFLADVIVPGNPWATFMAMSEAWERHRGDKKNLGRRLIGLIGTVGDDLGAELELDADELADSIDLQDRLETQLARVLSTLTEQLVGKPSHRPPQEITSFVGNLIASHKRTVRILRSLQFQIAHLQSVNQRQSLLMYTVIVIGILVSTLAIFL